MSSGRTLSVDEYLALSPDAKAADAEDLAARAMERREVLTAAEARAYGLGLRGAEGSVVRRGRF